MNTSQTAERDNGPASHFGVKLRKSKYGHKINRETYAIVDNRSTLPKFACCEYTDDSGQYYTDSWCCKHEANALLNYDYTMAYFAQLDHEKFDQEVSCFLKQHSKFIQVEDLEQYHKPGYYLMVLDEYSQIYVGTAEDISSRIRRHWYKRKAFDRLLFPMRAVETSIMSIDSFRVLDTTRIYVCVTSSTFDNEDYYIKRFSPEFVCNRLGGGRVESFMQAVSIMKRRNLAVIDK